MLADQLAVKNSCCPPIAGIIQQHKNISQINFIAFNKSYSGKSKNPLSHRLHHAMSGQMRFASHSIPSFQIISAHLTQQQNEDKEVFRSWLCHNDCEKEEFFSEI